MKIAIPYWQNRISPVFDVADNLLIVEIVNGSEQTRQNVLLDVNDTQARAKHLTELGANVLICGAISRPLEIALSSRGIKVISQTCGDVEQILAAFISGQLNHDPAFLMPGCRGRYRRFRNRQRYGRQKRNI